MRCSSLNTHGAGSILWSSYFAGGDVFARVLYERFVMHVVILAAGMGKRLGGDRPKPLTEISGGRTLIGNQIEIMSRLIGRDRIMLTLGYGADDVMRAHPDLMYVYNPRYAETNTAKSLLCALRKLDDDVLWINADLYFEEPAAKLLLDAPNGTRLLVNQAHVGEEEIKYTLHDDGGIRELSKSVKAPLGEALGMNIVVRSDLPAFVEQLKAVGDQDYFEKALENCTLARTIRATPVPIGGEYCREVDFPEDLRVVREHVAGRSA